jgi:drug/metabolite transporter (DMT)-like permease
MLVIGFSWIIIACLAGAVITKILPGKWEDHGPAVIMLSGTGAALTGMLAILALEGINSFTPSNANSAVGVTLSALGGLVGFVFYVMDVKRQKANA